MTVNSCSFIRYTLNWMSFGFSSNLTSNQMLFLAAFSNNHRLDCVNSQKWTRKLIISERKTCDICLCFVYDIGNNSYFLDLITEERCNDSDEIPVIRTLHMQYAHKETKRKNRYIFRLWQQIYSLWTPIFEEWKNTKHNEREKTAMSLKCHLKYVHFFTMISNGQMNISQFSSNCVLLTDKIGQFGVI